MPLGEIPVEGKEREQDWVEEDAVFIKNNLNNFFPIRRRYSLKESMN